MVAETSFTPAMPRSLDALLATDHAIHVHRAAAASGTVIVCGPIGGVHDASGALAIGLQERNGSGFTGVAYLAPSLTGGADATDLTFFLHRPGPAGPLRCQRTRAGDAAGGHAQIALDPSCPSGGCLEHDPIY